MRYFNLLIFVFGCGHIMAQEDTIYVNTKSPVLVMFQNHITGSIGSKEYVVKPGSNSLEIAATTENAFNSYLRVSEEGMPERAYLVIYKEVLDQVIYDFRNFVTEGTPVNFSSEEDELVSTVSDEMAAKIEFISSDKNQLYGYADINTTVTFQLLNVYGDEEKLYFKMLFENSGALTYNVSYLLIKFGDKKNVRKGSPSENKRMDILQYFPEDLPSVKAGEVKYLIVTTDLYTGTGNSLITISAFEDNGRRELSYNISNKVILKARTFEGVSWEK